MSSCKCPHCEYYMWEGKEIYECEFQDKVSELEQKNERLIDSLGIANKYVNKYHQTLQEIKAIAETCMSKDVCYECKYCDNCYIEDAEYPTYDICKLLIQLINKAESEG